MAILQGFAFRVLTSFVTFFSSSVYATATAVTAAATTTAVTTTGPSKENLATTFVGLVLVICVIFLLAKLLKRLQETSIGGKSSMKIISHLALGQKERVLVLDVNGKQIVVGVTAMQINLLMELDNPIIVKEKEVSFSSQLKNILRRNDAS